jgi:hypothetical protein
MSHEIKGCAYAFLLLIRVCIGLFSLWIVAWTFIALVAVVQGTVLSVLWGWFVAPFFAVHNLSIPYAIGLTLTFNFLAKPINYWAIHKRIKVKDSDVDSLHKEKLTVNQIAEAIYVYAIGTATVLAIGWVIHLFV